MIAFKDITPEFAACAWERFKYLPENEKPNYLELGKVLVWCDRTRVGGTRQKYIRLRYGVDKINNKICMCAKVFRAVIDKSFPALTEVWYDRQTQNRIMQISARMNTITAEQMADMLQYSIDGRSPRRRRSNIEGFPNAGYIYVFVSSACPTEAKLGETRRLPEDRALEMNRQTGVGSATLIPVWWERVSDSQKAEKELQEPFLDKKHLSKKDWFFVRPKDAIFRAMEVGRLYRLPSDRD